MAGEDEAQTEVWALLGADGSGSGEHGTAFRETGGPWKCFSGTGRETQL